MTMRFSEQEEQYIIKEMFNWHVSNDCPQKLAQKINKKLTAINNQCKRLEKIYDGNAILQ